MLRYDANDLALANAMVFTDLETGTVSWVEDGEVVGDSIPQDDLMVVVGEVLDDLGLFCQECGAAGQTADTGEERLCDACLAGQADWADMVSQPRW